MRRAALVAIGVAISASAGTHAQWPQWRVLVLTHPALLSDAVVVCDTDTVSVWALK
jgi:hypothetical protein